MPLTELLLTLPQAAVEAVSDELVDTLEALSVSVEDADAGTEAEQALFGEPGMPAPAAGWERSRLKALFDDAEAAERAAAWLLAHHGDSGIAIQALDAVPEQDWVRITQSQFEPVAVTPTFWIVPSWHAVPAAATTAIRLDPGLAFGTGTHPTTRMCLRWIAGHGAAGALPTRVLDYGSGSGILAIAAAKFGATDVDAVDIDPAAVTSTRDNATANAVRLATIGLPDAIGAPAAGYGLVIANILALPLKLLAPLLCGHLAPGGRLLLAGILERQAEEIAAAYAPWQRIAVLDREDGWALMGTHAHPTPPGR
jgi:ribosomal protein L11 methyltransferase